MLSEEGSLPSGRRERTVMIIENVTAGSGSKPAKNENVSTEETLKDIDLRVFFRPYSRSGQSFMKSLFSTGYNSSTFEAFNYLMFADVPYDKVIQLAASQDNVVCAKGIFMAALWRNVGKVDELFKELHKFLERLSTGSSCWNWHNGKNLIEYRGVLGLALGLFEAGSVMDSPENLKLDTSYEETIIPPMTAFLKTDFGVREHFNKIFSEEKPYHDALSNEVKCFFRGEAGGEKKYKSRKLRSKKILAGIAATLKALPQGESPTQFGRYLVSQIAYGAFPNLSAFEQIKAISNYLSAKDYQPK